MLDVACFKLTIHYCTLCTRLLPESPAPNSFLLAHEVVPNSIVSVLHQQLLIDSREK